MELHIVVAPEHYMEALEHMGRDWYRGFGNIRTIVQRAVWRSTTIRRRSEGR